MELVNVVAVNAAVTVPPEVYPAGIVYVPF
jgi:hypothetical protein